MIGAGAVVTQHIPSFAVAVGNPARVVRRRFSDALCQLLDEWCWWDKWPEELERFESVFHLDLAAEPEAAIDAINRLRAVDSASALASAPASKSASGSAAASAASVEPHAAAHGEPHIHPHVQRNPVAEIASTAVGGER